MKARLQSQFVTAADVPASIVTPDTVEPGKGWNVILRLYGPTEAWHNKTWKPADIELVN